MSVTYLTENKYTLTVTYLIRFEKYFQPKYQAAMRLQVKQEVKIFKMEVFTQKVTKGVIIVFAKMIHGNIIDKNVRYKIETFF